MSAIKQDRRNDRRQWQALAVIGVPILLAVGYGQARGMLPPLGFVLTLGAVAAGMIWYIRLLYCYRCPQCGQHLPYRGGPRPGAAVLYRCQQCDVLWDTGQQEHLFAMALPTAAAREPTPELCARIEPLLLGSNRIAAIKLWRAECGGTLHEAVFRINEIEDRLRAAAPEKFPARPKLLPRIAYSVLVLLGTVILLVGIAIAIVGLIDFIHRLATSAQK